MNPIRKFFLHNWQAKLVCLVLATAIWYVLRYHVIPESEFGTRPDAQQLR